MAGCARLRDAGFAAVLLLAAIPQESTLPTVEGVALQPLAAQARRLLTALETIGEPMLSDAERAALEAALAASDEPASVRAIQSILDPHCLVAVTINPESRVKVERGPARAELAEQGWR